MQKATLIKQWLDKKLIINKEVLEAFNKVKRENFILKKYLKQAYEDIPLPIGFGATVSQPTTVIIMTQALEVKNGNRILEVGTGSGYQAAILSVLAGEKGKIITTEFIKELSEFAKQNLKQYKNIEVIHTDGSKGYKQKATYDAIIITAAIPEIPKTLIDQLKEGGRLVAPVGPQGEQRMIKIIKKENKLIKENLGSFMFVPLKGRHGY